MAQMRDVSVSELNQVQGGGLFDGLLFGGLGAFFGGGLGNFLGSLVAPAGLGGLFGAFGRGFGGLFGGLAGLFGGFKIP
jgi:hypothetical protein